MKSRRRVNSNVMFLPSEYPRLILALLVSPQIALLMFVIVALSIGAPLGEVEMGLLFYVPFSYGVEIVLGVPLVLLFRYLRWQNLLAYSAGGIVIGLIVAVPLILTLSWDWRQAVLTLLLCAGGAGLSALTFWVFLYGFKQRVRTQPET